MWRRIVVFVVGAAFTAAASLSGNGQEPKKTAPAANAQEPKKTTAPIKGGIEGKVKKVDPDKMTLTITVDGRERTFTITEDTTMVGPRGGLVKRGLKDPRFHEGLDITVVASGTTAKELHLGIDHRDSSATEEKAAKEPKGATPPAEKTTKEAKGTTPPGAAAKGKETAKQEAGEEKEYPGKIKSVDPGRHMLVVSLVNGQDRSFMIAKDVKMSVKGTASHKGLEDPALKAGTPITVVTDAGGRKVMELKVAPSAERTAKEPKGTTPAGAAAKGKEAAKEEAGEDKEYPGKVKSVDPARHMLVISLLNGQDRSFMIAKDVKMSVKGTASQKGLEDAALKAGIPITVVTDAGGRKVMELKVAPPPASRGKKEK